MKLSDIDRTRYEATHSVVEGEETLTIRDTKDGWERPADNIEWAMYGGLVMWKKLAQDLQDCGEKQAAAAGQTVMGIGILLGLLDDAESPFTIVHKDGTPLDTGAMRTITNCLDALNESADALAAAKAEFVNVQRLTKEEA